MVRKSLNITVNGKVQSVVIRFQYTDWSSSKQCKVRGAEEKMWYTSCENNGSYHYAVVSQLAPMWYIELASLFEMINNCNEYQDLIPNLRDDIFRLSTIEEFIIDNADEQYRIDYINARIAMYSDIIANKSYSEEDREAIICAHNLLTGLLATLKWANTMPAPNARAISIGF